MPTWSEILAELQQLVLANPQPAPGQPSAFDITRRKYLQAVAALTHRNVILYASRWTQPSGVDPDMISIVPEDVQGFMEVVHGLAGDTLDLILHLPGGSAETTVRLVKGIWAGSEPGAASRGRGRRLNRPEAAAGAAAVWMTSTPVASLSSAPGGRSEIGTIPLILPRCPRPRPRGLLLVRPLLRFAASWRRSSPRAWT